MVMLIGQSCFALVAQANPEYYGFCDKFVWLNGDPLEY
jgi:hypothetical protein